MSRLLESTRPLIVVAIATGGFPMEVDFTGTRLRVLSKMEGAVVIDSRLRDALRRLRSPAGDYRRQSGYERDGGLPSPTAEDRVIHAIDVDALREADRIRLHRDVDDLELRVRALENRAGRAG